MPRTSAAALAVNGINGHALSRPSPPNDLAKDEKQVWRDTVDAMDAGWFPKETHGLLSQYCFLIIRSRFVVKLIRDMEKLPKKQFNINEYRRLLRDLARLTHDISVLARNMRMSQGSTSRQEYVKKRPMTNAPRPWEDDDEDYETETETQN